MCADNFKEGGVEAPPKSVKYTETIIPLGGFTFGNICNKNRLNDELEQKALEDSIKELGQQEPITLYLNVIEDGKNRYNALKTLGFSHMKVRIIADSESYEDVSDILRATEIRRHQSKTSLACSAVIEYTGKNNHKKISEIASSYAVSKSMLESALYLYNLKEYRYAFNLLREGKKIILHYENNIGIRDSFISDRIISIVKKIKDIAKMKNRKEMKNEIIVEKGLTYTDTDSFDTSEEMIRALTISLNGLVSRENTLKGIVEVKDYITDILTVNGSISSEVINDVVDRIGIYKGEQQSNLKDNSVQCGVVQHQTTISPVINDTASKQADPTVSIPETNKSFVDSLNSLKRDSMDTAKDDNIKVNPKRGLDALIPAVNDDEISYEQWNEVDDDFNSINEIVQDENDNGIVDKIFNDITKISMKTDNINIEINEMNNKFVEVVKVAEIIIKVNKLRDKCAEIHDIIYGIDNNGNKLIKYFDKVVIKLIDLVTKVNIFALKNKTGYTDIYYKYEHNYKKLTNGVLNKNRYH